MSWDYPNMTSSCVDSGIEITFHFSEYVFSKFFANRDSTYDVCMFMYANIYRVSDIV